jgi:hypothetical protein
VRFRIQLLLEHFNWELFGHLHYSPDFVPSHYHIFTFLNNWLGSQRFNNNEELMEGVKISLSSRQHTSLTQAYKNLFPVAIKASQFRLWLR